MPAAIALIYFALRRGKVKAMRVSARERSRSNESRLLNEARKVTPRLLSPEEIKQRERVSAAFGGEPTTPKQRTDPVSGVNHQVLLPGPFILPASALAWTTGPSVSPPVIVAAPFDVMPGETVDKVQDVARQISVRLNNLSIKVEQIAAGPGSVNERNDKIMLTVAKEWNLLPLSELD